MASAVHMHPWYRLPTLKRKSSFEYDSDLALHGQKSSISAFATTMDREPAPSPKSKRRRCDNLEHGFSQMSLNPSVALQHNPNSAPVVSLPPATFIPAQQAQAPFSGFSNAPYNNTFVPLAPASMPANVNPTPTPTSRSVVNGSGAQYPANDLSADISPAPVDNIDFSWYEPEKDRIIITDLGPSPPSTLFFQSNARTPSPSTQTFEREENNNDSESPFRISLPSSLFKRLNAHQPDPLPSLLRASPDSDPSKALVLFRPLSIPTTEETSSPPTSRARRERRETYYGSTIRDADDDAIEADDIPIIEEPPHTFPTSPFGIGFGREGPGYIRVEEIDDQPDDDAMDIE